MEPRRRPTRPMMLFSVVVLPAPLRPSNVTTSPSRTSKSRPWRMWLSPYQALRPATSSIAPSGMGGAEIGGDDVGVAGDVGVVAFREHLAARKDGDCIAEALHNREVVLD